MNIGTANYILLAFLLKEWKFEDLDRLSVRLKKSTGETAQRMDDKYFRLYENTEILLFLDAEFNPF